MREPSARRVVALRSPSENNYCRTALAVMPLIDSLCSQKCSRRTRPMTGTCLKEENWKRKKKIPAQVHFSHLRKVKTLKSLSKAYRIWASGCPNVPGIYSIASYWFRITGMCSKPKFTRWSTANRSRMSSIYETIDKVSSSFQPTSRWCF